MSPVQIKELRDLVKAYNDHQILLSTSKKGAKAAEPLIAEDLEKRAQKERQTRNEAREARGETVGKSLLQASQDLVKATRDAMTMYQSLHQSVMQRLERVHRAELASDSDFSAEDSASSDSESSDMY